MRNLINTFHKKYPFVDGIVNLIMGSILGAFLSDIVSKIPEEESVWKLFSFRGTIITIIVIFIYFKHFSTFSTVKSLNKSIENKMAEAVDALDPNKPDQVVKVTNEMISVYERIKHP